LAISSELSQAIIFVNSENFEKTSELSVRDSFQGMAAANGQLYVAENQTNSVSMLNPQSRHAQKRISVGITPRRLLSVPQKIYCTNFRRKSISDLRQNNLRAIQTIILNDTPLEMVFHNRHNKLCVGEKNTAGIDIIDTNINRVVGHVSLGA
jgi:YVTN family beta-propeller protein